MTAVVIANPTAHGGRARRLLPMISRESERLYGRRCVLRTTERPGHATMIARNAAESGARLVIAVGGDGTIHEVVNGLFDGVSPINPHCDLGIVNCGTGHGLAQSLRLPRTVKAQIDVASTGEGRPTDLGSITATGWDGTSVECVFVSECQVGLGGAVVAGVGRIHKALGGRIAFGSVALTKTLRYKACSMNLVFRDGVAGGGAYLGLTIGNGPYCGGGMKLVPDARVDDGHLDTLLIRDMSVAKRLATFSRIYTGHHVNSPHCSIQTTTGVAVQSERPSPVAADGELLGTTPCRIKALPSAIRIRRPACHEEDDACDQ